MRLSIWYFVLFMHFASLPGIVVETASLQGFLTGNEPNCQYDRWISHLAEGIAVADVNLYAPYDEQTNGFGDFRIPDSAELLYWNAMLDHFIAGDYDAAQAVLTTAGAPFQIVEFHDTDSGRIYYIIRELPDPVYYDDNGTTDSYDDETGAFAYGWGLFIYNPSGTKPAIVTVPHPCDDFPTPLLGYLAFTNWNARYLLINGAGREVRWTNSGSYSNAKSISDPSRNASHPLQAAYKKFADRIRSDTGWREFSAQIHSYDWNRHSGYANCQISAGNPRSCPNLPIRDLSTLKHDLINNGSHLMLPANTIGNNINVYLNDYYSVRYSEHAFTFSDETHSYAVNNSVDLPAYSQNQQMLYTQTGTSDYDVYEPFFHIELDELPKAYAQTEANYKWFYGWDETQQVWDMDNLFTHPVEYYSRWIYDLEPVLVETFAMDDGMTPATPENLYISGYNYNSVTLNWDMSSDFDFHTYEILYATQPIGISNYQLYSRDNAPLLASQACESITIPNLQNGNTYYFRIRAKDKNGNTSNLSQEVTVPLAEAVFACTPASVNFAQTLLGSPAAWIDVTISNAGFGVLGLYPGDVVLSGPDLDMFVINKSNLPVALESLESIAIPVCLLTYEEGAFTATLQISCNGKTTSIPLLGEVLPAGLVQIGSGILDNLNVPIQPNYAFTYSQSIYLRSDIPSGPESVRALYYFWNGLANADVSNDWVIYMGHTDKTSFSATNDWIPLTSLTEVFSGTVNLPATASWVKIVLDTPFSYNDVSNLVIAVDENEAGFDGRSEKFLGTATTGYRSLQYRSDTLNPNPALPPTATARLQGFPNILLQLLDEGTLPVELTSFTATFAVDNYVHLSWVTQSETGLQGYYIYRSKSEFLDEALLVSPLIDATNSSETQNYVFVDAELFEPGTYYYWLSHADFDGTMGFHGPITVLYSPNGGVTPPIPVITELRAIYPNPFNPTAYIPFSLAETSAVRFDIYNSRGQLIRAFSMGEKVPGHYQLQWDGKDSGGSGCGTGLYFFRMNTNHDSYIRKAVLIK